MSTKIYDAYRFPKKLNIDKLTKAVLEQRQLMTIEAQKLYLQIFVTNFVKFYDRCKLRPRKYITGCIADLNAKVDTETDKLKMRLYRETASIYSDMIVGNFKSAIISTDWWIQTDMEITKDRRTNYSPNNYSCKLLVIPCGPKLLAMTFGNPLIAGSLVVNLDLEDYHYQNQTDRPKNISAKAWNTRRKTWDKAIGPDYVPINHGFEFDLVNTDLISLMGIRILEDRLDGKNTILTKDYIKSLIPSIESRAQMLVETFDDYPNPPTKDAHYTEWLEYARTDEYKKWKAKKTKQVIKKLENMDTDVFDVICDSIKLQ